MFVITMRDNHGRYDVLDVDADYNLSSIRRHIYVKHINNFNDQFVSQVVPDVIEKKEKKNVSSDLLASAWLVY
ncbi:unnamed protein product, partial [Heterotrigona itama]